jgi:two-component system CheB/CheR fusion protein
VQALQDPEVLRGLVLVVFTEVVVPPSKRTTVAKTHGTDAELQALSQELSSVQQELFSTRQEMQTSREEANSATEEWQSANEELQSSNEELTTSKEEMQSMNEELQTLNNELQSRVDDLSRLTNDMKNLLDNTDIATVFLDATLKVRLFTAGSNRIFKLQQSDVGRPITDFASEIDYLALADDARDVLRTLVIHEQPAKSRDGKWFLVHIMPYRTLDNVVDGVAVTFTDITASKRLEGQLRATQSGLEQQIVDQAAQISESEKQKPV